MTSTLADAVTELATSFSGQLLQPSDAGYDDARKIHNGLIDKRAGLLPDAVVLPTSSMPSSSREG
jgi:hypothetical protein